MEIFHHLEEQNLFLIQTLQETEQTFDELKATMTKQRAGSKTKAEYMKQKKNESGIIWDITIQNKKMTCKKDC